MEWPDELAAGLPAPNPDEPTTLRQDILDELSDHLTSAAQRLALKAELESKGDTPDEQAIADRVLLRFGNPRRIARQLWFDAMKGKLRMQKLTASFSAVAAIGAVAGCVLLWTALDATRITLAQAIDESRKDRAASEKANRDIVTQLVKLGAESKKSDYASMEWNPLKFKLVLGEDGSMPAVGASLRLSGALYKGGDREFVTKKSDENGMVDFKSVRPGNYDVTTRDSS